ncbi:hypothetical protein DFP94_10189 [Fontibacillus phaseoli]|uniref:Uncharacterized protein n=1 Tax=Fontibacillus phaseoli TaxID=1416533 RepID=A0A369BLP1_9BACL|nr:hypothetical protein DFP94_10189 [Fontibacillus phaseoli]
MDDHVQLEFEPIYEQDIGRLTSIMVRAFDEDATRIRKLTGWKRQRNNESDICCHPCDIWYSYR